MENRAAWKIGDEEGEEEEEEEEESCVSAGNGNAGRITSSGGIFLGKLFGKEVN